MSQTTQSKRSKRSPLQTRLDEWDCDSESQAARAVWGMVGVIVTVLFLLGTFAYNRATPEPNEVVHECWRHPAWVEDLRSVCETEKQNGRILQACGRLGEIWEKCNDER